MPLDPLEVGCASQWRNTDVAQRLMMTNILVKISQMKVRVIEINT